MSKRSTTRRSIETNPFYVLGLSPDCQRMEVEREGQKLLGMLELGMSVAATYATPLGVRERTPELVREAMSELRDPQRRLGHELWARLDGRVPVATTSGSRDSDSDDGDGGPATPGVGGDGAAGWTGARAALGWGADRGGAE